MGRQRYIPIYVLFTFFTIFTMIFSGSTLAQEKPEFSNPDASDTHPYGVDYLIPEYFTGDKASILNKGLDSYGNRFIRPGNTNEGTTCWAYNSEDYENLYNQSMSRFGLTGGNEALFETQLFNQCIEDSKLIEYEVFIGPDYERSSDTYSYFKVKTSKLDSMVGTEREDDVFLSFNGWTTLGGYGHHNVDTRNQSSYIVAVRQVFTDNQTFKNTESGDDVFIYKNRYLVNTNLTDDLWHNELPLASRGEHNRYRGYFHLYYGWDYEREGYLDGTLEGLDTETPYGTVLRLLAENSGVDVNVRYRTTEDNTYRHIPLHQDSLHYTYANEGYYEGTHGNTVTYEALNTKRVREALAQYYDNTEFTTTNDAFRRVLPETPVYGWGKNFTYNDVGFSTQINLSELFNDFSETGVYKLYLVNRVDDMIVATELHVPQDVMMWANEHIKTGALGFLGSAYGNQIEIDYGTLHGLNRTPNVGDVFNINTIQSAEYGPSYFEIRYNNVSTLISQQDTRPIQHERGALLWFNPYHGEHGSDNEVTWNYSTIPSVSHANNEGYVIEHTGHSEILIDAEGNRLSERYTLNNYGYWEDIHIESQDIGGVSMNDDFVWLPVSIDDNTKVSQLESIFEQDTHTLDDFPISLTAQHVPNIGSGERVFNIEYLPFKEQGFRYTFVDADTGDVLYAAQDEHTRGGKFTDWLNGEAEAINLSDYVVSEDNAPIDTFLNISRFAEGSFEGVQTGYERVPNQTVDVYNWDTQTLEVVSLDDIVDEGVYYTMSTEQLKGITGSHAVTWDIEYQEMPEVTIHFEDEKGRTLREPLTTYASRYNTFGVLDIYEDNVWYNTDNIFNEGTQYERVTPELALDVTEDTEITMTYKEVRSSLVTTNYTTMRATSSMNTTSTVLHTSVISYQVPYNSGYVNLDGGLSFSILKRVGTSDISYQTTSDKRVPRFRADVVPYERYFCTNGTANELHSVIQNLGATNYNCDLTVIPPSSSVNRFTHNGRPVDYFVVDRSQNENYNYGVASSTNSPSWTFVGTWTAEAGYNKKFKFRYIDSVTGSVMYESDEFYNYLDDMVTGKKNRMTQSEINHSLNLNYDRLRSTGIRNTFTHNGIDYTVVPNQRFDMYNADNDSDAPIVSRALQWLSGGGVSHNPLRPAFTHDNLDITWNILYEPEPRRLGIRHSFHTNQNVVPSGHSASNRIMFPITYFDVPHGTRVNENTYCVNGIANHLYSQLRSYGWVENDCLLRVVPRDKMTHKYTQNGFPVEYGIRRIVWSGNNGAVVQDGHYFPNYYVGHNKKWNYRFIDSVTGQVLHESDYIGGYLEDLVKGKKSSLTQMEYDYSRSLPFRETNKLTDIYDTYRHTNGINYTVVPNQSFDMYASGDEDANIVNKRIQFLTNGRVSHAPLRPAFTPDNQNITWNILYEPEPRTVNFRPRIISTQNVVRVGHTRPNSEIKPIISFDVPYGTTIDENTYCVDGTANHLRTTLNTMGAVTGDCHLTLISADAHGMYAYTLDGHPVKYAVRRNAEVISNYTSVGTRNLNFYVGYNKKFKYRYIDSVTGEVIYESDVAGNILEDLVNGRKEPLTLNELSYVRNLQHLQLPTDIRNTYTRNGVNYTAVPNQSFPVYENNNDNARIVNKRLEWYSNGNINPSSLRPAFTPDNLDITWNILFEPEKRTFGIRHSMGPNEGAVPDGHTAGNRRLFNIDYFDVPHGTVINENTYCVDGSANHLYSKLRSYGAVMDDCLLTVVARDDMQLKYRIDGRPVEYAIRANEGSNISKRVLSDDFLFLNYFNGYNKKFKFRFIDSVTGAVIHESDEFYNYLDDMVKGKKNRLTQAEIDFSLNLNYDRVRSTGIRDTYMHNGLEYTVVPNQRFDMYNADNNSDAPIVNRALQWLPDGGISHNPLRPAFTRDNLDITWNILYEPEPRTVNLRPRITSTQNVVRVGHTHPNSQIKPTISFDVPYGTTIDESTYCVDGTANHLRTTLNNMGAVTGDCHLTLISADAHGMYAYTLDGHPVEYAVRNHVEVIPNYTSVGTRNLNFYVGYNKKFKYRYIDSDTGEVLYESEVIGNILEDLVNGRRTPLTNNELSYSRNLQHSQIPTGIRDTYTHNGVNYTVEPNQTFLVYENSNDNARLVNRNLEWMADGRVSHAPLRPAFTPDNLDITWNILFEPENHEVTFEFVNEEGTPIHQDVTFEVDHGTHLMLSSFCAEGTDYEYLKDLLPEGIDGGYDFYCLYNPIYTIMAGGEAFDNTPYGPYELISPSRVNDATQRINSDTTITFVHREKPINFTYNYRFMSSGALNVDEIQPVGHSNTWVRPSQTFPVSYFDVVNSDTFCVDGVANHLYNDVHSYGKISGDCHLDLITPETGLPHYTYRGNTIEYALGSAFPSSTSVSQWYETYGNFRLSSSNLFDIAYNKVFQYRYIDATTGEVLYESEVRGNVLEDYLSGKKATLTSSERRTATLLNFSQAVLRIEERLSANSTFNPTSVSYKIVPNQTVDVFTSFNVNDHTVGKTPIRAGEQAQYGIAYTPDNEPVVWNILFEPENHDVTLKFVDVDGNDLHEPFEFKVPSGYTFRPQTFCKTDYPEFESVIADFVPVRPSNGTFEECIGSYTNIQPEKNVPNDEQRTVYKLVSNNNMGNFTVRQNTTRTYVFEEAEFVTQAVHRFSSQSSDYPDNERPMAVDGSSNDIIFSTSEVTYKPRVEEDATSNLARYTTRTFRWDLCDWLSHEYNELLKYNNHVQSCNESYIIPSEKFTTQYTYKGHPVDYVARISGGVAAGPGTVFSSNRGGGIHRTYPSQQHTTHSLGQHQVVYNNTFQYRLIDVTTGEVINESQLFGNLVKDWLEGKPLNINQPLRSLVYSYMSSPNMVHSNVNIPEVLDVDHELNPTNVTYRVVQGQTFEQYTSTNRHNFTTSEQTLSFTAQGYVSGVRPAHGRDSEPVVWNILYEPENHDVTLEFVNEEGTPIHQNVTFEVEHDTLLSLSSFCEVGTDYEYLKDLLPENIDGGYDFYCLYPPIYTIFAGGTAFDNTPYGPYELISPSSVYDANQRINSDTTITLVHREKPIDFKYYYEFVSSGNFNVNEIQPVGHSNTWVRPTQTFPVRFTDVVKSDTFCVDGVANHLYDDVHSYGKTLGDCHLELITPDTGLPHYVYQGNTIDYALDYGTPISTSASQWYEVYGSFTPSRYHLFDIAYNKVFQYRYIDATTGEVLYESEATGNILEDYLSGKKDTLTFSERMRSINLNNEQTSIRIEETLPENSTFNTTSVSYKIVPNQTVDVYASPISRDLTVVETPIRAGTQAQYRIAYTPDNEPVVWNILYEPDSYYSGSTLDPVVHIAPNDVSDITLDDVEFDIEARDNEGIGWRLTDEEILARANVLIDESNLAGVRNAVITTRLTDAPSEITDSNTLTVFGTAHDGETESDLGTAYRYDNTRDKASNLTYQLYISFDYTNAYITSGDETEVFWGEEYGDTVEVVNDDETEEIVSLGKMEIRIDLDVDPPYKSELDAPEIEDDAYVEHTHELLIGREITNLTFGIGEDYGEGQAVNGVVGERSGNTITRTYDDYTHYTVIEEPEDGIISYHITTSHPSVTPYYETIEIMPTYLGTLETQGAVHINEYMSYASEHGNDLPDDYYAHYDIHYIDENLVDELDRTLDDKFRIGMLYDADTETFTLDRAFGLSTKYGIQVVTDATVPVVIDEGEDTESLEGIAADVDAIETELAEALGVALNLTGLDATEDSLLEGLDYTVSRYFMPIDKDTYILGMETTDSVEMSNLGLNDVYVNYDKSFTFEQYLMGNVNDDPVYAAQPSVPEQVEYQTTHRYQGDEMEALIETITTRLEKYNLFRTIDDGVLLEHLEE